MVERLSCKQKVLSSILNRSMHVSLYLLFNHRKRSFQDGGFLTFYLYLTIRILSGTTEREEMKELCRFVILTFGSRVRSGIIYVEVSLILF